MKVKFCVNATNQFIYEIDPEPTEFAITRTVL